MKQKCYGNLDKRSDLSSSQSLGVSNYKLKNQRVGFDLFQKKKKIQNDFLILMKQKCDGNLDKSKKFGYFSKFMSFFFRKKV